MSQPIETDQELSLIDHLLELRNRLIRSVVVIAVAMLAMAPFARKLYTIISEPLVSRLPEGTSMIAIDVAPSCSNVLPWSPSLTDAPDGRRPRVRRAHDDVGESDSSSARSCPLARRRATSFVERISRARRVGWST